MCYLVIYSYLVISPPFFLIILIGYMAKMGKLVMLFGKAGYAFWESWLCFLGKLVMLFGKAGYAFWESWLCQIGNIKYV
ncbi:MAG: hypothetical protein M1467_03115 [Deltaproteobacteria bacterium]|nr:hypothetical protein [Deltaproteobacteria bacterium]